jgi:hypothetical protein
MKLAPVVLMLLLYTSLAQAQQPQVAREWLTVAPESAGAEVLTPLCSKRERTNLGTGTLAKKNRRQDSNLGLGGKAHLFVFSFHDRVLPEKILRRGHNASTAAVKGAIASTLGALDKVSVVRSGGLNGREVTYTLVQGEKNKMRVASRFYLDGGRLYQLSYIAGCRLQQRLLEKVP